MTAAPATITAVGVVVPARDEAPLVGGCLAAVRTALARLPAGMESAVAVIVDRCTDDTARVVHHAVAGWSAAGYEVNGQDRPLGALRHRGVHRVLAALARHPPASTWLLHTDADSRVTADWALRHLAHAGRGAHAVAGLADLHDTAHLHAQARRQYRALLARSRSRTTHRNVYGANLGVRADAYLALGGFHPRPSGEDRNLVDRLHQHGFRVAHPTDLRVTTSARLVGRADGGLADLLHTLHDRATAGPT